MGGVWSFCLRLSKETFSVADNLGNFVGYPFISMLVRGEARHAKFWDK